MLYLLDDRHIADRSWLQEARPFADWFFLFCVHSNLANLTVAPQMALQAQITLEQRKQTSTTVDISGDYCARCEPTIWEKEKIHKMNLQVLRYAVEHVSTA